MARSALAAAAGFLAAPMLTNLIPYEPATEIGRGIKKALAVIVGAQVISMVLSRKIGNALLAGGMVSVGVDVLRYLPIFGAGGGGEGVSYYFPHNSTLRLGNSGNGGTLELPDASLATTARLANRFGCGGGY